MDKPNPQILIVGAGMSGIMMGIKLLAAGYRDFRILEKAPGLGGTWRENRYPGLSCDVPSFFYSMRFEPNLDWSHRFSPGPEILAYFERVAEKYGIVPHIRFDTEVTSATWRDGRWQVETAGGENLTSEFLIGATGALHVKKYPAIDGLDKWSNNAVTMEEMVRRVHDAGIEVMGAFVFGLEGDSSSVFDETLEFINKTGIHFIVANIIQPYPGTGTFLDAVRDKTFLPWATCPADSDVQMDYNWPLFDGAHVLVRPEGMSVEQLQEGYYYFLREAYSMAGIARRYRGARTDVASMVSHFTRNYIMSRYGMTKTAHAIRRKGSCPVGHDEQSGVSFPTGQSAIPLSKL